MKQLSLWIIILCAAIMLYANYIQKFYTQEGRIIESDVQHYYAWLPAVFVYNDISLKFLDDDPDYNRKYFVTADRYEGRLFFKATMGVALMQSVFFLPVHYYLKMTGDIADGFSTPYKIALILSSIFYFVLTLFIIRYFLLKKLKLTEFVTALTLLIVGLGTNIVIYVIREPAMSHVYSFFTIGLFAFMVDKLFHNPTLIRGLLTGIIFGLLTLIRPVNFVVGILLLTWQITTWSDFKERILFYLRKPHITIAIMLSFVMMWIPQFLYYKFLTGKYEFFGYGSGGGFFFNNPQIISNLFSYRKGWFLYTPLMLLAIFGLIPLYKFYRKYFWSTVIVLVLLVYINSSWYSWWFGGGFGQRAYIDIYMLLALPIAALLNVAFTHGTPIKVCSLSVIVIMLYHNYFQVSQYLNGAIHYNGMTKEAYWDSFGRLYPSYLFYAYLEMPDMELAKKGIYPKHKPITYSKKDWLNYLENRLRQSPEFMNVISKKAQETNKPVDTIIKEDAENIYKSEFE